MSQLYLFGYYATPWEQQFCKARTKTLPYLHLDLGMSHTDAPLYFTDSIRYWLVRASFGRSTMPSSPRKQVAINWILLVCPIFLRIFTVPGTPKLCDGVPGGSDHPCCRISLNFIFLRVSKGQFALICTLILMVISDRARSLGIADSASPPPLRRRRFASPPSPTFPRRLARFHGPGPHCAPRPGSALGGRLEPPLPASWVKGSFFPNARLIRSVISAFVRFACALLVDVATWASS
jgi:hypothetical protein